MSVEPFTGTWAPTQCHILKNEQLLQPLSTASGSLGRLGPGVIHTIYAKVRWSLQVPAAAVNV